jgi:hypothetical protein
MWSVIYYLIVFCLGLLPGILIARAMALELSRASRDLERRPYLSSWDIEQINEMYEKALHLGEHDPERQLRKEEADARLKELFHMEHVEELKAKNLEHEQQIQENQQSLIERVRNLDTKLVEAMGEEESLEDFEKRVVRTEQLYNRARMRKDNLQAVQRDLQFQRDKLQRDLDINERNEVQRRVRDELRAEIAQYTKEISEIEEELDQFPWVEHEPLGRFRQPEYGKKPPF